MDRKAKFEKFIRRAMEISPVYLNIFGKGIPGMGGASAGITGGFTSSSQVTDGLQSVLIEFARAYTAPKPDAEKVLACAKQVEGALMAEQTLGVLNAKQADALIDELHDLIEAEEK